MTSGKTLIKWYSAFYSTDNSVGKETPAYLGDNSLPSPSTAYGNDISICFNCFTATRGTDWCIQGA